MTTTPVKLLPSIGNLVDGDKLVGERVAGTTSLINYSTDISNLKYTINGTGGVQRNLTSYLSETVHAADFGMVAGTGADCTAAFNNAVAYCCNHNRTLLLGSGTYTFTSRPAPIPGPISIIGTGPSTTALARSYTESTPTNGFLTLKYYGAVHFKGFYIGASAACTGGAGISMIGTDANGSPDYSTLEDLVVSGSSGTGTWNYAIYVDGSSRTGAPGVRDLIIRNCDFFASTTYLGYFKTINNFWMSGAFFSAGGTSNAIRIDGITGNTSHNIHMSLNYCEAAEFDYAVHVIFDVPAAMASITNTANVAYVMCRVTYCPSIQSNWFMSNVLANNYGQINGWSTSYSDGTTTLTSYTPDANPAVILFNTNNIGAVQVQGGVKSGWVIGGSATGGYLGVGTVNAGTGYYVNNNVVYYATGTDVVVSDGGTGRSTATAYAPLCGGTTSTSAHQSMASGNTGQLLASRGGASIPIWTTPTYPVASATSRKLMISDGTNWVASTETYAVPGTAGNVLRSDGTNWTAGKAVLTTDVTEVLPVANGGSGVATATAYSVICAGTTATGVFQPLGALGAVGAKLTSGGAGVLPSMKGGNTAFLAYVSTAQSITNSTSVKMRLDTEVFDTGSLFDSTTNYRFTPNIAGYYLITVNLVFDQNLAVATFCLPKIYRNGAMIAEGFVYSSSVAPSYAGAAVNVTVYLNGSTDYIEAYCYQSDTTSRTLFAGPAYNYMSGVLVEPT